VPSNALTDAYLRIVERAALIYFDNVEYGRLAKRVIELLMDSPNEQFTDDKLAIMLNLPSAEIRRVLNVLSGMGLVGVSRRISEDMRQEYVWYVDERVIRSALAKRIQQVMAKLMAYSQEAAKGLHYYCPRCHMVFELEEAEAYQGTCPVCDTPLEPIDGFAASEVAARVVSQLNQELERLQRQ